MATNKETMVKYLQMFKVSVIILVVTIVVAIVLLMLAVPKIMDYVKNNKKAAEMQTTIEQKQSELAKIKDDIGNFFFATTYKYPTTDLEIKYKLDSYSEGVYSVSILGMKNKWSDIATTITIEKEPPYPSDTIVIDAPEANCISYRVEADSVTYRVDLVCKGNESTAGLNMTTGLWKFDYWFSSYRIINLQTGQQINIGITWGLGKVTIGEAKQKEDTNLLRFHANNRTGSAEDRRSSYFN